ncbi:MULTISPECIES: hypothetical protein [Streptomyces]|uniref:hypothetical protein n=1 Tax=Streptomyces TaxID=1883 RepID=UPI000AF39FF9|nr:MULTISPECIES: hypothetical protein [Streptomyces]
MEMQPAAESKPWGDLSTSLVVSGRKVDSSEGRSADEQAAELIGFLGSRTSALDALKEAGKSVRVEVAGVAESGTELSFSPDVLAGLAELGLPVAFTTFRASGEDEEDPLAWLG